MSAKQAQRECWAVVPAAGRGLRAGGEVPKQYRMLHGRTLLEHSLRALLAHPGVAGLVVVVAAGDPHWPGWRELDGRPVRVATGGAQRADSVLAGLRALPDEVGDEDQVLVHDAARPCLSRAEIERLLAAGGRDGALLGLPVADTLKRVGASGRVAATVPRDGLWRALTPQCFPKRRLMQALQAAAAAGQVITDEAMAMEQAGFAPVMVEGMASNIKVTKPGDFQLAEYLLRQTGRGVHP